MEAAPQTADDFAFLYDAKESLDQTRLYQGDILARTDSCVETIRAAHQYYAESIEYSHFVIITQSCDLVRRSGKFNAPYITIAAAKKLSKVLDGLLPKAKEIEKSTLKYRSPSEMKKGRQLIERYLNNTENNYFFLPKSIEHGIEEDLVVFLHLSIALRKDHYDVLSSAKIAQLNDVFQAKLGWLKGNIYSRVATPDLDEESKNSDTIKDSYYNRYLPELELSGHQADRLKKAVAEMAQKLKRNLTVDEVLELARVIPNDLDIVAEKLVDRLIAAKLISHENMLLARRTIANSPVLKGSKTST